MYDNFREATEINLGVGMIDYAYRREDGVYVVTIAALKP